MSKSISKVYNFLFVVLLLSASQSFAQKKGLFSKKNILNQYATVGIGGGSSHYFGDLAPYSQFYYGLYTNVRWNGSINYTRFLTSNAAARVSYTYARIYGDDNTYAARNLDKMSSKYIRNLSFRNDLQEFVVSGIFNFLPQYGKGAKGRSNIMPYGAIGIGFYGHNPKARGSIEDFDVITGKPIKKPWEALRPMNTSGQGIPGSTVKTYSLVQPVLPIALGLRVKINSNFDFTAEAGLRLTPFDYLDDVGDAAYPSKSSMITNYGNEAAAFSYRASEDYAANSGILRNKTFVQAAAIYSPSIGASSPSVSAEEILQYTEKRGYKRIDSYILTQFTLSYVLSNNIKCPVIK